MLSLWYCVELPSTCLLFGVRINYNKHYTVFRMRATAALLEEVEFHALCYDLCHDLCHDLCLNLSYDLRFVCGTALNCPPTCLLFGVRINYNKYYTVFRMRATAA